MIDRKPSGVTWTTNEVARKVSRAALALTLRQVLVQGLNILGGVLLARMLSATDFGLYGICLFLLAFLTSFGDAGLGASLIRQPESPSSLDYQSVFTVQQVLVGLVCVVFWAASPFVVRMYRLPEDNIWIFYCVALAFFVTSYQTIPAINMERNLDFNRLAWIEVSQAVVFNAAAVALAFAGLQALSFGVAILLRSLTGATLANVMQRWDFGWRWDFARIKRHSSYGIPYQASSILNLLKDLINPLLVGFLIGPFAVGYINWATTVANYPLIFVIFLNRLFLPTLSKLVHTPEHFNRMLTSIVRVLCSFVYGTSVILFVFRFEIVQLVFGSKWLPAMVLFPPFIAITVLLAPTVIAIGALNALGNSRFVFLMTLVWVVITWLIGILSISRFGWESWGWVNLIVNLTNFFMLRQVTLQTGFSWFYAMSIPVLIAGIVFLSALLLIVLKTPYALSITVLLVEMLALMVVFLNWELRKILEGLRAPKGSAHAA
jgi:O-antigen/teichoic acid export membrane protein